MQGERSVSALATPFVQSHSARWADRDFNQHMRNSASLARGEETPMRYLDANGWTVVELERLRLGPVVVDDKLTYKRELRFLERSRVASKWARSPRTAIA